MVMLLHPMRIHNLTWNVLLSIGQLVLQINETQKRFWREAFCQLHLSTIHISINSLLEMKSMFHF